MSDNKVLKDTDTITISQLKRICRRLGQLTWEEISQDRTIDWCDGVRDLIGNMDMLPENTAHFKEKPMSKEFRDYAKTEEEKMLWELAGACFAETVCPD